VYVTQKICNIQKLDLGVELSSGQQEVKDGDTIKVKMTIPKPPAGKSYTKGSLLIDTPIPFMAMPLMVSMDHFDVTDAEIASGVIEKEFKLGHMAKSKTCDFSVTFNSQELSGIHGSMQIKYKAAATPPPVNYGDASEFTSSWTISGGAYSWGTSGSSFSSGSWGW